MVDWLQLTRGRVWLLNTLGAYTRHLALDQIRNNITNEASRYCGEQGPAIVELSVGWIEEEFCLYLICGHENRFCNQP